MKTAHIWRNALRALLVCTPLLGCGGDGALKETTTDSAVAHEALSVPVAVQPAPQVNLREAAAESESQGLGSDPPVAQLTPAICAQFARGISLAEARALSTIQPVRVGGDAKDTEIYRWTDDAGNYITVRFDAGLLVTKSSLGTQRGARDVALPLASPTNIDVDTASNAQIAPGVYIPLERAIASATHQPMGIADAPVPLPPVTQPIRWRAPEPRNVPDGPRIAIAGASRRAREEAANPDAPEASSYRPRAKLPAFARSLREGSFEIRFVNPGDAPITAGLRQGNLGNDAVVPPGGQASIKVDRGTYGIFFVRDDEPFTLYEANPIVIDGFQATDVEVHLKTDDVEVRLIDYGKPED